MANPVRGTCVCPLCDESGAEIREGVKGRLYIVCDGCVTMTTTMSRQGRALIENRLGKQAATAPAHKVGTRQNGDFRTMTTATTAAAPDAEAAALLAKAAELDAAGTPPPIDPATGQPPVPIDYAGEAEMLLNLGVTMAAQFYPCVATIWTADKQKAVAAAAAPVLKKYGFTLGDFMGAYKEEIGLLFVAGPLVLQTLDAVKAEKIAAIKAKREPAAAPAGGLDLSGADPEA